MHGRPSAASGPPRSREESAALLRRWHERLGHAFAATVVRMSQLGVVRGLPHMEHDSDTDGAGPSPRRSTRSTA